MNGDHGLTGYTKRGCRCPICTEAQRQSVRRYRAKVAERRGTCGATVTYDDRFRMVCQRPDGHKGRHRDLTGDHSWSAPWHAAHVRDGAP